TLAKVVVGSSDDNTAGTALGIGETVTYEFRFDTEVLNDDTILQNYLGIVGATPDASGFFPNQNLRQSYTLTRVEPGRRRFRGRTVLGQGAGDGLIVPPNNQGLTTPFYNEGDDGDRPARGGVADPADLDPYTAAAVATLPGGYRVFAGQRDDGFYADIQSIFDLDFSFGAATGTPTKPFDSQGGFNVHTIVLDIPMAELGGATLAGVYTTTVRQPTVRGRVRPFRAAQVGRQGNPLFAEALVAGRLKDAYNQTKPDGDEATFAEFAEDPELARVLGLEELIPGLLRSIYIPDLIKVDLTTGPARLAGEEGFDARSVFGGDVLQSEIQDPFDNGGFIPGGWPNGRRFGDDVIDIALIALGAAGGDAALFPAFPGDRVDENDITYNDVFPYAATPLNGRNRPDGVRAPR
ncbi:MAG: DUF4331 family protein, partial [Pseudomonadota bacterium]